MEHSITAICIRGRERGPGGLTLALSEREAVCMLSSTEQNGLAFAQGESETARRAGVCYACVK
jgi:hypothetical protein